MKREPTQESSNDTPALDWGTWLQHHGGKLYYFAVHWNAEDPEDALQHAVVQTARAVTEGRCEAAEEAALRYAYTTLRHRLHRVRAQQEQRQRSESAWGREHPLLTADDATEEECRLVEKALQQLPSEEADIVVLHLWENMSFKDIADTLGISINTALGRMRYAIINLRRLAEENNMYTEL